LLDEKVLNFVKDRRQNRYKELINSKGELKTYVSAREYLKKLHDKPLGRPLYNNYTKNIMELGTRGGGKSYWASWLAVFLTITDSMKVYDITGEIPAASVCIGSSNSDKSSELCQKVVDGLNFLAISVPSCDDAKIRYPPPGQITTNAVGVLPELGAKNSV
jgi:hypothetical protein